MRQMKKFLASIPNKLIAPLFVLGGVFIGLGIYSAYMSRAFSYLSDDPAACVNCHIMSAAYQSWAHSSHARWATCNDCHVPQHSVVAKLAFKAKDGLSHAAAFTFRAEAPAPRPTDASNTVIMSNCIRCHEQLNTALVKTGMLTYGDVKNGRGNACWDCHRNVPHTRLSGIASAPNAPTPFPASPVPGWLKK